MSGQPLESATSARNLAPSCWMWLQVSTRNAAHGDYCLVISTCLVWDTAAACWIPAGSLKGSAKW
jgi:hypothetical protein